MSQRCSALFCATGALGGKPIGRVRVKHFKQWLTIAEVPEFRVILKR